MSFSECNISFFPFLRRSSGHLIKIMKATTKMAEGKPHETKDGLHYTEFILKWVRSVLKI